MKKTALIGHTGFVGSNLKAQRNFTHFYNSKNSQQIQGQIFDEIVCAGVSAFKWKANNAPEEDLQSIQSLIGNLSEVETKKFILISTIDVYKQCRSVDEDTVIARDDLQPYGLHRRLFEEFAVKKFSTLIIRLPGLFGDGLKKNIIYDFLNNNCLESIHQDGVFQFYNLAYLWKDIQIALNHNLKLINFATEPVSVKELAAKGFGVDFSNALPPPGPYYDIHTRHAGFWDKQGRYLYSKSEILEDIRSFVELQKKIKRAES